MNKIKRLKKFDNKIKVIAIVIILFVCFVASIYFIDSRLAPSIITASDVEVRAKVTEIINSVILNEYSKNFNYDTVIHVDKDNEGNIIMIKADILKMNKIASNVALESQKDLKEIGKVGIKIPLGYVFRNNLLASFGPNITVKMHPVGYIETKYLSEFESAGINQTRHKIYVQVKTNMRVIVPFKSSNIEVKNELPIAETIIVGKVPETAINLGFENAGFKLPSGQ